MLSLCVFWSWCFIFPVCMLACFSHFLSWIFMCSYIVLDIVNNAVNVVAWELSLYEPNVSFFIYFIFWAVILTYYFILILWSLLLSVTDLSLICLHFLVVTMVEATKREVSWVQSESAGWHCLWDCYPIENFVYASLTQINSGTAISLLLWSSSEHSRESNVLQ